MRELCRILGLDLTEVEKARPRFMSWDDDDASWRDINWQEIERWAGGCDRLPGCKRMGRGGKDNE